jgi:hypothetical protein
MRKCQLVAAGLVVGLLLCAPASGEPWQVSGGRVALAGSGLSFPEKAGILSLTAAGEASLKGEGVDAVAQLKSPDEKVFGTLFVYLPAYADAALAAWELDKVIREHLGPDPKLVSSGVVPAGGTQAGAIRRVYVNAVDGKLVTAAALLKAGRWMAVARVSGPPERRAEVEAALDALVSGLSVSGGAKVDEVAELQVSDCPAVAAKTAKHTQLRLDIPGLSNDPMTRMLIDSTLAAGLPEKGKEKVPPFPHSIADNGHRPVCIRERIVVDGNPIDLMQAAGDTANPSAVIGIVNDAGRTIEMRRGEMGPAYMLRVHDVGRTRNYGAYDRLLTSEQVAGLVHGDPKVGTVSSETVYKADGTFGTTVFIATGH